LVPPETDPWVVVVPGEHAKSRARSPAAPLAVIGTDRVLSQVDSDPGAPVNSVELAKPTEGLAALLVGLTLGLGLASGCSDTARTNGEPLGDAGTDDGGCVFASECPGEFPPCHFPYCEGGMNRLCEAGRCMLGSDDGCLFSNCPDAGPDSCVRCAGACLAGQKFSVRIQTPSGSLIDCGALDGGTLEGHITGTVLAASRWILSLETCPQAGPCATRYRLEAICGPLELPFEVGDRILVRWRIAGSRERCVQELVVSEPATQDGGPELVRLIGLNGYLNALSGAPFTVVAVPTSCLSTPRTTCTDPALATDVYRLRFMPTDPRLGPIELGMGELGLLQVGSSGSEARILLVHVAEAIQWDNCQGSWSYWAAARRGADGGAR
jgi:hypothetical protein